MIDDNFVGTCDSWWQNMKNQGNATAFGSRCKDQGAIWIPTLGPLGATELLVPNFGTTRHSIGPHLGTQLCFSWCVAGGHINYLAEDLTLRIYNYFGKTYFLGPKVQEYRLDKLMASGKVTTYNALAVRDL